MELLVIKIDPRLLYRQNMRHVVNKAFLQALLSSDETRLPGLGKFLESNAVMVPHPSIEVDGSRWEILWQPSPTESWRRVDR
jgi:hypothetical protein